MRFTLTVATFLLMLAPLGPTYAGEWVLKPAEGAGDPVSLTAPLEADHHPAGPAEVDDRFVVIDDLYVLPWFEVDRRSHDGLTTLLAIRNPWDRSAEVDVSYRSVAGGILTEESFGLDARETRTINLRDVRGLGSDPDGVTRGWAVIESDRATSVDYFFVTPSEDFATGGRVTDDLCRIWGFRFLSGGAFSGGTEMQIYVRNPLGASSATDPPTARIGVYSEPGERIGTVNLFTADRALEMTAEEILRAIPGQVTSFGALVFEFQDGSDRGYVQGTYSAESRFSIGMSASCLRTH